MDERKPIPSPRLNEAQRSVQRELGRCMLRLQQYELLLKSILPYAQFAGEPAQLPALLAKARHCIDGKTMGSLVGMLTENYLRPDVPAEEDETDSDVRSGPSDFAWMSSRAQLVFDVECYNSIKADLKELVALRNELVHHFLSRFDLKSIESCAVAETFLENSYQNIDKHYATLRGWANTMVEAQTLLASVVQSPVFRDFLCDGICPDGTVHWNVSGIVQGLRDVESELTQDGWTSLNDAIAWLSRHAPEQIPERYGCRSWQQVLHESKQFDIFKQDASVRTEAGARPEAQVWYRSRRAPVGKDRGPDGSS